LPAVSGLKALHTLRVDALHIHSENAVGKICFGLRQEKHWHAFSH
jgi:hypothetical protein